MLGGPDGERLWAYWGEKLAGQLPILEFPTDRPRPAFPTYQGASHDFTMDAELSCGLKALAMAHGATLYMVLLAAFQVALSYHTGQEDLVVGTPMVGRSRAEFEGIVGLFTNPVVLRTNLSGNPSFGEFLGRVRRTVLDALEHQDFPAVLLVERLRPSRDLSRPPLCQVMFVLDKPHGRAEVGASTFAAGETGIRMNPGGLALESFPLERRAASLDLVLLIIETHESLSASMRYNTDLFNPSTMARLSTHFETLLRSVVKQPLTKLNDLKEHAGQKPTGMSAPNCAHSTGNSIVRSYCRSGGEPLAHRNCATTALTGSRSTRMQPEAIEGFQLSPQQKHLWSLQQADGSLPYRAQCSILIEGSLDLQILEAALRRVFERHEILRTSFQSAPCANAPVQVVSAECMARIDKYDLSACDPSRQEVAIDRLYREMGDLAL